MLAWQLLNVRNYNLIYARVAQQQIGERKKSEKVLSKSDLVWNITVNHERETLWWKICLIYCSPTNKIISEKVRKEKEFERRDFCVIKWGNIFNMFCGQNYFCDLYYLLFDEKELFLIHIKHKKNSLQDKIFPLQHLPKNPELKISLCYTCALPSQSWETD